MNRTLALREPVPEGFGAVVVLPSRGAPDARRCGIGRPKLKRIFLIGASGYIGSHLARAFVARGLEVAGLSRSAAGDAAVEAAGATPVRGSMADIEVLRTAARRSDAVVHAARYAPEEAAALDALVDALSGTDKALVLTSGASVIAEETGGRASPNRYPEDAPLNPPRMAAVRVSSEQIVLNAPARGVRGAVIRPPIVYGDGANGKVSLLAGCAARTGVVRHVGPGENQWGVVHIDDLCEVFRRAIERTAGAAVYHPVAGEVSMGDLARAVGRAIGRPAAGWDLAEAEAGYGKFQARVGLGSSCRPIGAWTEEVLGFRPERNDLLQDVASGTYTRDWTPAADLGAGSEGAS
jgi:nucleoside-diphosphate-sugar epimerase